MGQWEEATSPRGGVTTPSPVLLQRNGGVNCRPPPPEFGQGVAVWHNAGRTR